MAAQTTTPPDPSAPGHAPLRILLADRRRAGSEPVRALVDAASDLAVVGNAPDMPRAAALAATLRPDVALVSTSLLDAEGWVLLQAVRAAGCRVLVLAAEGTPESLLAALEEGVEGYCTVNGSASDIVAGVRAVARGEIVVPPDMAGPLVRLLLGLRQARDDAFRCLARLTRRERQVLGLLTRGLSNRKIAETLVISPDTARTHVSNVLGKLDVSSRNDAAAFVIRHGFEDELVTTDP